MSPSAGSVSLRAILLNESPPAHWIRLELVGYQVQPIGDRYGCRGPCQRSRPASSGQGWWELCIDQRPEGAGRFGEGRSSGAGRGPLAQRPEYDADRPRAWPYSPGRRTRRARRQRRPSATNRGTAKMSSTSRLGAEADHPPRLDRADVGLGCRRVGLGRPAVFAVESRRWTKRWAGGAGRLAEAEAKVRARLAADPDASAPPAPWAQIILKRPDPPSETVRNIVPSPSGQEALDSYLDQVGPGIRRWLSSSIFVEGDALNRLDAIR